MAELHPMFAVYKKMPDKKWCYRTPHGLETRNTKKEAERTAALWFRAYENPIKLGLKK
jgi:hypothetical protein